MARRPKLNDSELYEIATYLKRPEVDAEIHAELPNNQEQAFAEQYFQLTGQHVPNMNNKSPYYVWRRGANKQGRELRIYFKRVAPEPPPIKRLYTDFGKWYSRKECYRINHSSLVEQLFECGFLLGLNTKNGNRIESYMRKRFPVK